MKIFTRLILIVVLSSILAFTPLVACEKTRRGEDFPLKTKEQKTILSLWEIDTFEGGYGSRADFLSNVLEKFIDEGVFVMVSSYTAESAKKKMNEGVCPDIVSFGIGAGFVAEYATKLSGIDFIGGEIGGEIYAYPWCRGGYFLISKTEVNGAIDRLIVSKGEKNSPLCALGYSLVSANDIDVLDPLSAYTEYLKGDCVLLGTQRDIRRLTVRSASFIAKPIEKFCDLFQYVAITSTDKTKYSYAERVAKYIYENSGENLSAIGMLPIKNNFYDGALGAYDNSLTEYTLSPFTADSVLEELNETLGGKKTAEERAEKLKNTVKHL